MFTKLIGYLSIFWGNLWIVKPDFLKSKLISKTGWYLFWLAAGVLFFPLAHFGKKAGVAGIVLILAGFWLASKITKTTLRKVFDRIPLAAFRAGGLLSVASGIALVGWPKK